MVMLSLEKNCTNLQLIRRICAIHFKGLGGTQAVPMPKVVMLEIQAELPGTLLKIGCSITPYVWCYRYTHT